MGWSYGLFEEKQSLVVVELFFEDKQKNPWATAFVSAKEVREMTKKERGLLVADIVAAIKTKKIFSKKDIVRNRSLENLKTVPWNEKLLGRIEKKTKRQNGKI